MVMRRGTKILVLVILLCAAWSAASAAERGGLKIGDPIPPFTLTALDRKPITLPDDGKGRVVVIHFWAAWCRYCLEEMPALENLYQRYREKGLMIYAVNVHQTDLVAQEYAQRIRISYPVLLDLEGKTAKQYGVIDLPRTFILDRRGTIRYKLIGEASEDTLNTLIKKAL
jgi:peroxiredoxin